MVARGVALSRDGKVLYALASKGLLAINTADLTLAGRYLPDLTLNSLRLSPDGKTLYTVDVTQPESPRLLAVDAAGGARVGHSGGASMEPWAVLAVQ